MIELHCHKGRHVSFIRCDNCGQEIRDAGNAMVAWHTIPTTDFVIIHKGACALEFAEHSEPSSDEWGAMELDWFLLDLFHNAGLHWHYFDEMPQSNFEVAPEQSRLCAKSR